MALEWVYHAMDAKKWRQVSELEDGERRLDALMELDRHFRSGEASSCNNPELVTLDQSLYVSLFLYLRTWNNFAKSEIMS
jgi:hypothetical protein